MIQKLLLYCQCPEEFVNKLYPPEFNLIIQAINENNIVKLNEIYLQNKKSFNQSIQKTGENALHLAIQKNNFPILQFLIERVNIINVNDQTIEGDTPLMIAVLNNKPDYVRYLVDTCNAKVNISEYEGHSPLMAACAIGSIQLVHFFLSRTDSNLYQKNKEGQTALHRAAYYGHKEIIQYLVKNSQLSPLMKDKQGNTCLHLTYFSSICNQYTKKMNKFLLNFLSLKSDRYLMIENQAGQTPLDILQQSFDIIKDDSYTVETADIVRYIKDQNSPPQLWDNMREDANYLIQTKREQQENQDMLDQLNINQQTNLKENHHVLPPRKLSGDQLITPNNENSQQKLFPSQINLKQKPTLISPQQTEVDFKEQIGITNPQDTVTQIQPKKNQHEDLKQSVGQKLRTIQFLNPDTDNQNTSKNN